MRARSRLIDGWLIAIDNLVNGTTIVPHEPVGDVLELFHIEFDGHDARVPGLVVTWQDGREQPAGPPSGWPRPPGSSPSPGAPTP